MTNAPALLVAAFMFFCGMVRPAFAQAPVRDKLNIVSIVTDDQALWTLSCYGSKESHTPNLDRIAAEGARFSNAFVATPVCSPSRATFFTGRYGTQVGITDFLSQQEDEQGPGLRPGTVTWPAVLQRHGYVTMLAGKWHLGRNPASLPGRFGFDRNVGRVIAALEQHGLWDKTVILFTSDHGYNIGEHTVHGKGNAAWVAAGLKGPWRPNLWDTSLRVPLLVRWPGVGKAGQVIEDVVSNVDTFASVLGMLGVEAPPDWKQEGVDFTPRLRGAAQASREALFAQYDLHNHGFAQMRAARNSHWKLASHFESHMLD